MSPDLRLRLFNAIEGGSQFWSEECIKFGPAELIDRIEQGFYDRQKKSAFRIKENLLNMPVAELCDEINAAGARFFSAASD